MTSRLEDLSVSGSLCTLLGLISWGAGGGEGPERVEP